MFTCLISELFSVHYSLVLCCNVYEGPDSIEDAVLKFIKINFKRYKQVCIHAHITKILYNFFIIAFLTLLHEKNVFFCLMEGLIL